MTDAGLPTTTSRPGQLASLAALAAIPEEEIWLGSQKSARTRRAYRQDVAHFMRTLGITTPEQLRQVDHRAVIAWEGIMREQEGAAPSTVRRRLAALSSLFKHLVRHGSAGRNPVVDVQRPNINREEGSTAAFSKAQARRLLDAPSANTVAGLRDRAILSVGLQVGLRRAEIAALAVGDLHQNRGLDALRLTRKGGRRDALAINPQTAARIRAYLELAGHGGDHAGPLFRPLRGNARPHNPAGRMDPDAIDRVLRKYAAGIGLGRGYSAHSMRATFITTALENGAQLEDVQKAAGHRDPSTTKLYDRRGYNPEKAASFFATYRTSEIANGSSDDEQTLLRNGIEEFARTISAQPLGLAIYAPEPWAEVRLCYENVRRKADRDGGRLRLGWMFQHKLVQAISGPGYLIAIHHAVWHALTGQLFDVTPRHPDMQHHPLAPGGNTLFLVDDSALLIREGRVLGPRPTKFFALDGYARLAMHVQRLQEAEEKDLRNIYAVAGP